MKLSEDAQVNLLVVKTAIAATLIISGILLSARLAARTTINLLDEFYPSKVETTAPREVQPQEK